MAATEETDVDVNYFVCTLGEAATINAVSPQPFETVNEFLKYQSQRVPNHAAVGIPIPSQLPDGPKEWDYTVLTFHDLYQRANRTAKKLWASVKALPRNDGRTNPSRTVVLLAPSSLEFVDAWLGLMQLGLSVLLIAPQCQPAAIAHLCKECGVMTVFYDVAYEQLAAAARDVAASAMGLGLMDLIKINDDGCHTGEMRSPEISPVESAPYAQPAASDVAYLHHTSGTSTGLPKPVRQSHRAAVGVLPRLDGRGKASWTTTPLYHGGVADCFRAWTSDALIWLFPGREVPVTALYVRKSLDCARRSTRRLSTSPVKYFSSVPYVLQMVLADSDGAEMLRNMDLVGVGGAALPQDVGDDLVAKGVNLVSRYGSAECGFLMSSHRNYGKDKEWLYLRNRSVKSLILEAHEGNLSELVVHPDWPHMAKRNREDGSFATADLFEPHPHLSHAWKYHSRADSQLTLITGKKFDPAPLEDAIATSPLLSDVLVFGDGHHFPGALLFRSAASADLPAEKLREEIWSLVERSNADGQPHTRISKSMLMIMPKEISGPDKSSKGTILRGEAGTKYHIQIHDAYESISSSTGGEVSKRGRLLVPDEEIPAIVMDVIKSVGGNVGELAEDRDLYSLGVDSVACMQIRTSLSKKLLSSTDPSLPLNVVYDCGTVEKLSQYLINTRKGQANEKEDDIRLMHDLVEAYGDFSTTLPADPSPAETPGIEAILPKGNFVVLTGATGSLGAQILTQLLSSPSFASFTIICLVRAASPESALLRVSKSLVRRQPHSLPLLSKRTICLPSKFSDPFLGLSSTVYTSLATHTRLIVHAAWAVNFNMRLRSFEHDHIAGLRQLINLALNSPESAPPRFIFCSSTASVLGPSRSNPIPETISTSPDDASPLGYSRSKWVAEAICSSAHLKTRMRGSITVLRIGQLCGDTDQGIWNVTEAWPLMLSSVHVTHSLPRLDREPLGWLPVDTAAKAVLQISESATAFQPQPSPANDKSSLPVYHILNPDRSTTWSDLLTWMSDLSPGLETLPPRAWVERLQNLSGDAARHPARKLLGLWRDAYCRDEDGRDQQPPVAFSMDRTTAIAPAMKAVRPIDEKQFRKIWAWLEAEMQDENRGKE